MVVKKKGTKTEFAKASKITLNKLALMVARGFDKVDQRFNHIDLRLGGLSNGLSDVQQDVSRANLELKEVNLRLDSMEEKMIDLAQNTKEDTDILFKDMLRVKQKIGLK